MKIVCISDSHNQKPKLPPEGDLLIHSGDLTMLGTKKEVEQAVKWLGDLARNKYEHGVILVPGNHDFLFEDKKLEPLYVSAERNMRGWIVERDPEFARLLCDNESVDLLVNESTEVNGIKIYGSPVQPWFHNWAFNVHRDVIGQFWNRIPEDTQLLITHGPPYGIGDLCFGGNVGCSALLERIKLLKDLKMHVFGHIHEGAGEHWFNNKLFVNASVLDGRYNGFEDIISVEWPSLKVEKMEDKYI